MFSRLCGILGNPDCYVRSTTKIPYATWKDALTQILSKDEPWSQEFIHEMPGTGTYEVAWCFGIDEASFYGYCEVDPKNKTYSLLFKNATPENYETDRISAKDMFFGAVNKTSKWTNPSSNIAVYRKSYSSLISSSSNYDVCIASYNGYSMVFLFDFRRENDGSGPVLKVRFKRLFLNSGTDEKKVLNSTAYLESYVAETDKTFNMPTGIENMVHVQSSDYSTSTSVISNIKDWNNIIDIRNYMLMTSTISDAEHFKPMASGTIGILHENVAHINPPFEAYSYMEKEGTTALGGPCSIRIRQRDLPFHFECDDTQYYENDTKESNITGILIKSMTIPIRPYFVLFKVEDYVVAGLGQLKRTSDKYINISCTWRVFYAPNLTLDNKIVATNKLDTAGLNLKNGSTDIVFTSDAPTVSLS